MNSDPENGGGGGGGGGKQMERREADVDRTMSFTKTYQPSQPRQKVSDYFSFIFSGKSIKLLIRG